jgi:hypothetical protein
LKPLEFALPVADGRAGVLAGGLLRPDSISDEHEASFCASSDHEGRRRRFGVALRRFVVTHVKPAVVTLGALDEHARSMSARANDDAVLHSEFRIQDVAVVVVVVAAVVGGGGGCGGGGDVARLARFVA